MNKKINSKESGLYLKEFFKILKKNSIKRKEINWDEFEKAIYRQAKRIQLKEDLYKIIKTALIRLNDNHSYFIESPQLLSPVSKKEKIKPANFKAQLIDRKWGYLLVPGFSGFCTKKESNNFAQKIQNLISKIDEKNPKGWIIDLRKNCGGNIWPMLCGLGPLFSQQKLGSFIFPSNKKINWYYKNGKSIEGTSVRAQVKGKGYKLRKRNIKIALLIGSLTISSGEIIVISFQGQKNVKTFGGLTHGKTTANRGFRLSDGSMLFLTVANLTDRNGKIYGGKIIPDKKLINEKSVLKIALDWLNRK